MEDCRQQVRKTARPVCRAHPPAGSKTISFTPVHQCALSLRTGKNGMFGVFVWKNSATCAGQPHCQQSLIKAAIQTEYARKPIPIGNRRTKLRGQDDWKLDAARSSGAKHIKNGQAPGSQPGRRPSAPWRQIRAPLGHASGNPAATRILGCRQSSARPPTRSRLAASRVPSGTLLRRAWETRDSWPLMITLSVPPAGGPIFAPGRTVAELEPAPPLAAWHRFPEDD